MSTASTIILAAILANIPSHAPSNRPAMRIHSVVELLQSASIFQTTLISLTAMSASIAWALIVGPAAFLLLQAPPPQSSLPLRRAPRPLRPPRPQLKLPVSLCLQVHLQFTRTQQSQLLLLLELPAFPSRRRLLLSSHLLLESLRLL